MADGREDASGAGRRDRRFEATGDGRARGFSSSAARAPAAARRANAAAALPPEAFAREIEAWLDEEADDVADTAETASRRAYAAAPSRGRADEIHVAPHDERFADPFDEAFSHAFDGDPDDVSEALRSTGARPERMRMAVIFAAGCIAALGALSMSIESRAPGGAWDPDVETGTTPPAGAPDWSEALDWDAAALAAGAIETGSVGRTPRDAADRAPETPAPATLEPLQMIGGATGEVAPYLDAGDLADLLRTRPVKCALSPTDAGRAQLIGSARDQVFGFGGEGCESTTDYRVETGLYTTRSLISEGATLEINSAFAQLGDQLCHDLASVSVLVIGDGLPFDDALALEREVKASFAETGRDRVCYRLRDMSATLGPGAFRADVFADGVWRPDRSDPRPFLMRRRY